MHQFDLQKGFTLTLDRNQRGEFRVSSFQYHGPYCHPEPFKYQRCWLNFDCLVQGLKVLTGDVFMSPGYQLTLIINQVPETASTQLAVAA